MILRRLFIVGLAAFFALPAFAQDDAGSKQTPRPQPAHSHATEKGTAPVAPSRPETAPASAGSAEKAAAPRKQPRHDHRDFK